VLGGGGGFAGGGFVGGLLLAGAFDWDAVLFV